MCLLIDLVIQLVIVFMLFAWSTQNLIPVPFKKEL